VLWLPRRRNKRSSTRQILLRIGVRMKRMRGEGVIGDRVIARRPRAQIGIGVARGCLAVK